MQEQPQNPPAESQSTEENNNMKTQRTKQKPGPRSSFQFPEHREFSVAELAAENNLSVPTVYNYLKAAEAGNHIRLERKTKGPGRGRPTAVYTYHSHPLKNTHLGEDVPVTVNS